MRLAVLFVLLAAHALAYSQVYPQRAVRLVIAAAPGGSTDVLGRVFAAVGSFEDEANPDSPHGWMIRLIDASALRAAGFSWARKATLSA